MEHSNRNIYVAGNFIAEQHVDIQILHADKVYTQPQQSATIKPKVIIAEDIPTTPKSTASQKAISRRSSSPAMPSRPNRQGTENSKSDIGSS